MRYIVLDLEWNQPLSYNSTAYRATGGKLIFELIQIGAVCLNDDLEITDSFNQLIQPTQYVKLHPRIRRITGISQEDVCDAPLFNEAAARFSEWCGDDSVILTWGGDDVSVFQQNLNFFKCGCTYPTMYDLQKLYGTLVKDEEDKRLGLKAALERFEIDPEEDRPFHNALNDAYYTALVFKKCPDPKAVLQFAQKPKELRHEEREYHSGKSDLLHCSRPADAMKSRHTQSPPCPVCGKHCTMAAGYLKMADESRQALFTCPDHGLITVRIRFQKNEENKRVMMRTSTVLEEQSPAYVSTKILQWNNKLSAQQNTEAIS